MTKKPAPAPIDGREYVEYSTNNSGGSWWLTDAEWEALETAGWVVDWVIAEPDDYDRERDGYQLFGTPDENGVPRWMGARAKRAKLYGTTSISAAISSFEFNTSQDSTDLGCYSCCGAPHSFTARTADGKYIDSYSPEPGAPARYGE